MKLVPTNRVVNEKDIVIRHPDTGMPVAVVDTEVESSASMKYFNRLVKQGDLKTKPIVKGSK